MVGCLRIANISRNSCRSQGLPPSTLLFARAHQHVSRTKICLRRRHHASQTNARFHRFDKSRGSNDSNLDIYAAAVLLATSPLLLLSDVNASEAGLLSKNESIETNKSSIDVSNPCQLSWVTGSNSVKAKCRVHGSRDACSEHMDGVRSKQSKAKVAEATFDPVKSRYFEISLSSPAMDARDVSGDPTDDEKENSEIPILHNTIVVLPNLISPDECKLIVDDAERILEENKAKKVQGVKTESWTVYSRFDGASQKVMDRVLGDHVLSFLEQRMPDIAKKLTIDGSSKFKKRSDAKDTMGFHWDDPVVIKYVAGNQLAPHEDMRDLTVVVPLNPLENVPMGGGGTRFWPEGTTPDGANADSTGGISVKPLAGSGVLFNGDITHSGNAVLSGTRFVLMTSITYDDVIEDDDDDDGKDDQGR